MKTILFLTLIFNTTVFAAGKSEVRTVVRKAPKVSAAAKRKNPFIAQKYSNAICKQKYIPMKMEQSLNGHLLTVTFTPLEKMESFSIGNVRGLKDVTVTKFQEITNQSLEVGDTVQSAVELSDFSGLVYVVFDVTMTINGVSTGHSIPIPVGTLSREQIKERSKNIRESKVQTIQKEGTSTISVPPQKYHEMQIE